MFSEIPVIYAVGTTYQIFFYVPENAYAWIRIKDLVFEDTFCGNLRSAPGMRSITVPQSILNEARGYTLCLQTIKERKSYFTKTKSIEGRHYRFCPVPSDGPIRAFMLGDAHGDSSRALSAAKAAGAFDFLILNGDMNESIDTEHFALAHNLASELCLGEKPVIYARGNHENRGAATEKLKDYIPLCDGCTYYTFRLGSLWGVVLDCGEDKVDDHPEYGGGARFHKFRQTETEFLHQVIAHKETEYDSPDVRQRIAIAHTPFPHRYEPLFEIEHEIYRSWCDLLNDMRVDVLLSAHLHRSSILQPGDEKLKHSVSFPLVVGTENSEARFGGTALSFDSDGIEVFFVSSDGSQTPPVLL